MLLPAKRILQSTCQGLDWDEPIPSDKLDEWKSWLAELDHLNHIKVPRCVRSSVSADINRTELHTFTDASEQGYGCVSYLRSFHSSGQVESSLLFAKSRVVPVKGSTIPRLELQAMLLGALISDQLHKELSVQVDGVYLWTDSEIGLAYIQNTKKKLKTFVRNRVRLLREVSKVDSWFHVSGADNPADIASRGCTSVQLRSSIWFSGPGFLSDPTFSMPTQKCASYPLPNTDVEVQGDPAVVHAFAAAHVMPDNVLLNALNNVSSWDSAVKVASIVQQVVANRFRTCKWSRSVQDLQTAEKFIFRNLQSTHFRNEIQRLTTGQQLSDSSSIKQLDPFLDADGLMRVGGRSRWSTSLPTQERHPVLIPKQTHVALLLVRHYHELCKHQGRELTMSYLRAAGFWIPGLSSAVRAYLSQCVLCRKLRGKVMSQKMADLPTSRVNPSPPFSYVGLDYFGPFEVKEGRRYLKRYGVIFTCFYSRAVHVEVADDMTSDCFINCLRTFISIRGTVRQLYCDQGSNFVGASNELAKALANMTGDSSLKAHMERNKIDFQFGSPHSSHMGGVWERQIRTFRNVLNGLVQPSHTIDTATLRTIFYECMNIVNSRPLTSVNPDSLEPLTPNHLIQMKSTIPLPPPPGVFEGCEYSRKRWLKVP